MKRFLKFLEKKAVSTDSVRFSYDEEEVLRDITMDIKGAKITAIIGKSGSGKSTLLKLISGIAARRYFGRIMVFGKSKNHQKHNIGYVPQELAYIPDLPIIDNIRILGLNAGISEKRGIRKAVELMKLLKLEVDLKKLPDNLSGGQKARLNIILSLLHNPKIVILDEPFVGLDFLNRRLLWHFIESMKKKGKSIIVTSHLLSEIQEHVDRLIILKNGKVFFTGKLESLKEKLKMRFIFEVKFPYLSKESFSTIKKYCDYKDIKILDRYEKYMMFALSSLRTRNSLQKLFARVDPRHEIISLREPNLDEIFLKT